MRIIAWILAIFFTVSGCTYAAPPGKCHPNRVITSIEIDATHGGVVRKYQYSDPGKISAVMTYLRKLEPELSATIAPETFRADHYEIRLSLSDGEKMVYRQLHNDYLQKGDGSWHSIDESKGAALATLLSLLPPDPS